MDICSCPSLWNCYWMIIKSTKAGETTLNFRPLVHCVSRTAQLVFQFPASVSCIVHSADVNSLCPEKLLINLFEVDRDLGVQDTVLT